MAYVCRAQSTQLPFGREEIANKQNIETSSFYVSLLYPVCMIISTTARPPVERITDVKKILLEILKGTNAAATLLLPIMEAAENKVVIDEAELRPVYEALQELFTDLGIVLSDVLVLEDDIAHLQRLAEATQRDSSEETEV